ncbi:MAG: hypothetical protein IKM98_04105 [Bacteroidales bacterium]|nr:hypothetical protein [Bacteroidales bacterium]
MKTLTANKNKQVGFSNHFEINARTQEAKLLVAYLKSLSFVKFLDEENLPVSDDIPNETTLKAMKDAEEGRTYKGANSVKELMDYLKS